MAILDNPRSNGWFMRTELRILYVRSISSVPISCKTRDYTLSCRGTGNATLILSQKFCNHHYNRIRKCTRKYLTVLLVHVYCTWVPRYSIRQSSTSMKAHRKLLDNVLISTPNVVYPVKQWLNNVLVCEIYEVSILSRNLGGLMLLES